VSTTFGKRILILTTSFRTPTGVPSFFLFLTSFFAGNSAKFREHRQALESLFVTPFLCNRLVVYHPSPVTLGPCILTVVETNRSCVVLKYDWIRKTFTYVLIELKSLDEVTTSDFQTC
jgi:hypothetical protein